MVRKARTEDIPQIFELAVALVNSIKLISKTDCFEDDPDQLLEGLAEFVKAKVEALVGHIVLVEENGEGITGFLVGCIHTLPKFYKHNVLGQVEAMYPLSFKSKEMVNFFDAWAMVRGATARLALCPHNHVSAKMFVRDKMDLTYLQFLKDYQGA